MRKYKKLAFHIILSAVFVAISGVFAAEINIPSQLPDPDGNTGDTSNPLKVYVMMHQSNRVGFGRVDTKTEKGVYVGHELALAMPGLLTNQTATVESKTATCSDKSPRIINIINFIRQCEPRIDWITEDVLYQTVVKQIDIMNKYNLKGTFLLQYDALVDTRYQQLLKELDPDKYEIGAWWEIPQPLVENSGYTWRGRYPWDWHADVGFATGYTPEERTKLVDTYMAEFKKIFGYYPKSVGSWFIDAHTLQYMHEKYGIVASCNCKDQIGTDGYTLWGGYWNQAYYPSVKNAYMPAQNAENQANHDASVSFCA